MRSSFFYGGFGNATGDQQTDSCPLIRPIVPVSHTHFTSIHQNRGVRKIGFGWWPPPGLHPTEPRFPHL